jgi:integrase
MNDGIFLDRRRAKAVQTRRVGCKIKVNRHGRLAFQIFWNKQRTWEGTELLDTSENRRFLEAKAVLIGREIKKGAFDYLKWFPEGNRADVFRPKQEPLKTIGEYFRAWILRKTPPVVRPGLERDYRDHFRIYILPKFEDTLIAELTPALLEAFRTYLLTEYKARTATGRLSLKSVKNIIDSSFRAMIRDARTVDYLIDKDHFEALIWPRKPLNKPDPFDEEERDKVTAYFREKIPFYYPLAYTLFFTGMRPSEALALTWGDVGLRRGEISIEKSLYLGAEAGTKTPGSERVIKIHPRVVDVLRQAKPLHVTESSYVFKNEEGRPVDFHTWRGKVSGRVQKSSGEKTPHGVWYRALRGAGVRARKPYCTRHTFISVGLTHGVKIKWLAEYCGTSVAMIEKHYGKYLGGDSAEQLNQLFGSQSETLSETFEAEGRQRQGQVAGISRKEVKWAHLDSNQGPTGYEPVALTN